MGNKVILDCWGYSPCDTYCMNPDQFGLFLSAVLKNVADCHGRSMFVDDGTIDQFLWSEVKTIFFSPSFFGKSYQLNGTPFPMIRSFTFSFCFGLCKCLSLIGSLSSNFVDTAIIPIRWKVFLPFRVRTLWSMLSGTHCVKHPVNAVERISSTSVVLRTGCLYFVTSSGNAKSKFTQFINKPLWAKNIIYFNSKTKHQWRKYRMISCGFQKTLSNTSLSSTSLSNTNSFISIFWYIFYL